ncbi:TetR/AcrR family transcriptional regulator [Parasulfitobacter algicola]|uniref:TetR/AcrR family transcriptional regulator n=1 Tax=Parasulfitobacter algicola TaxID=2614809 RepID=A0ABX2IWF1_9RHOB|nr:TetR/AcrR family transcriptional regulator [Sulfitobacter algicola]NSX55222.1 TetR/AcrR family transcriptional regulator [Sulfitobacter algicola]
MNKSPALSNDADDHAKRDGRRLRSVRSREQIAKALINLVQAGNFMPRSHELATASGLSLRTVFRHIEDMESLYRDLAEQIEADVMPILLRPYESHDWKDQLNEAITKRAEVYERILPIKVSADVRRFRSEFLMENYRRGVNFERAQIKAVLPAQFEADPDLLEALDLATSFENWRRMRYDQNLTPDMAERVMRRMVQKLVELL